MKRVYFWMKFGKYSLYKVMLFSDFWKRVAGIEPAYSAWEADILPLNYTRVVSLVKFELFSGLLFSLA